jgi:CRP-like cAMP-binding protein
MQSEERSEATSERKNLAQPHPISELLDCPAPARELLDSSAQFLTFDIAEVVFRQGVTCRGLYLVISGQFVRKAERLEKRLVLGPVRPGQLVELAPLLCNGTHTYTMSTQESGSLLLLPKDALYEAFRQHPPLQMHLLEELAREVSRGYIASSRDWSARMRHRSSVLSSD